MISKSEEVQMQSTFTEEQATNPSESKKDLSPIRCVYTVGLREDGQYLFTVDGTGQGLIELLGLHEFARYQILAIKDSKLGLGDALTFQLAQAINQVLQQFKSTVNVNDNKTPPLDSV